MYKPWDDSGYSNKSHILRWVSFSGIGLSASLMKPSSSRNFNKVASPSS